MSDIAKTLHLALAPFQVLAAYQDRLRNFIDNSVRRVPEDKRMSPAPQILGPVVEGIRYEPEGTEIDEMFSYLLSCSMDRDRVHEAHPSFPIIIRQISSDEAKILSLIESSQFNFVWSRDYDDTKKLFVGERKIEVDDLPKENLIFPENVLFYFEHLDKLGLAGIFQEGNQEPIMESDPRRQSGIRVRSVYRLTDFGKKFVKSCTRNSPQEE